MDRKATRYRQHDQSRLLRRPPPSASVISRDKFCFCSCINWKSEERIAVTKTQAPALADPIAIGDVASPTNEARVSWRNLGQRLKSITPAFLARMVLLAIGIGGIVWLGWATWPALLPFIVGAVIAYAVLPFTNWLDRFLPRILAVTVALLVVILLFAGVIAASVTILGRQIYNLYQSFPTQAEVDGYIDNLDTYLQTLPTPAQTAINNILTQASERVRANAELYNQRMIDILLASLMAMFNTLGFILGFLVVPAWLLLVLKDQKAGARAIQRLLPDWMLPDAQAIWAIFDRSLRAFIEGQFVMGLFMTLTTYIGFLFLDTVGLLHIEFKLAAAIFIGVMQLIPNIGPIIVLAIILLIWLTGTETSQVLLLLGLYLVSLRLLRMMVEPRVERKIIAGVHPALLIMAIVALSEFGWLWILLAAPITAVVRDIYLYIYGRLQDPPRPAGLLPGDPLPTAPTAVAKSANRSVPLAYRHGRAAR